MAHIPLLGEAPAAPVQGLPLLRKGFRPFFLLAGAGAVAIVPTWLAILGGVGPAVDAHLADTAWHAHELLFGFAAAVIAGFLLTAVGNWTGRETLTGPWLGALGLLWLAARVALLLPVPRAVAMGLDLAFLPALGVALGRPLLATKNRRNYFVLAVLAALWLSDLGMWSLEWRARAQRVAVDVVVLLIVVVAGRVVPMFTRNATRVASIRNLPSLDRLAALAVCAATALDAATPSTWARVPAYAAAAVLVLARSATWGSVPALRVPLLWILHAGHAFVALGFALRALPVVLPVVPDSSATHAFTVGAIGCTTLGMMARVALGHSGRPLEAGRPIAAAFALVTVGAAARVFGPMSAATYAPALFFAGAAWTSAFVVFLVVYVPILLSPRIDGKPG